MKYFYKQYLCGKAKIDEKGNSEQKRDETKNSRESTCETDLSFKGLNKKDKIIGKSV